MNGEGMRVYFTIFLSAIIVLSLVIALLRKAKQKKILGVFAVGIFICYVLIIHFALSMPEKRYESIPSLSMKDGKCTILNEGTGSMGSFATCEYSKEEMIEVVEQPSYHYDGYRKFGYTFQGKAKGELFLLILENDCGDLAYADVYHVNVSENLSLEVTHVENIRFFSKMTVQEFIDDVSDRYGFSKSLLEDRYLR